MKAVQALVVAFLLLAFPVNVMCHWGTRWTLGRYWMLKPLIVDGRFADGSPVDVLTQALADCHEEVVLAIACFLVAAITYLVRSSIREAREAAQVWEVLKDVPKGWLAEQGIYYRGGRYFKGDRQ